MDINFNNESAKLRFIGKRYMTYYPFSYRTRTISDNFYDLNNTNANKLKFHPPKLSKNY